MKGDDFLIGKSNLKECGVYLLFFKKRKKCLCGAFQLDAAEPEKHFYFFLALENSTLKGDDFLIGKSNLNFEIYYIIVRKTILFLNLMIYLLLNLFKCLLSFL